MSRANLVLGNGRLLGYDFNGSIVVTVTVRLVTVSWTFAQLSLQCEKEYNVI